MARRMVCEWGMSELGPMSFGRGEGEIFLGRDFARQPDYSEDTARKIDAEVNRIVDDVVRARQEDHHREPRRPRGDREAAPREGVARRRGDLRDHRAGDRDTRSPRGRP